MPRPDASYIDYEATRRAIFGSDEGSHLIERHLISDEIGWDELATLVVAAVATAREALGAARMLVPAPHHRQLELEAAVVAGIYLALEVAESAET
jgi:hypothetical protein